jgi:ribonuclease P protein component
MPRIARKITQFTQSEIKQLFRTARTISRNAGLSIRIAPRSGALGRLLIITSRKIGSAPERNKIRRQLKAIFYQEKLYELPYDFIIHTTKESILLPFQELKARLTAIKH